MKTKKPRFGFFRRLAALIFENWGLKILSLVLALLIYYALKPTDKAFQRTNFQRTDERNAFQP